MNLTLLKCSQALGGVEDYMYNLRTLSVNLLFITLPSEELMPYFKYNPEVFE